MPTLRKDIQALRAVAVLLVLAYHVWPNAVRGGFIGVDVFFVLSGYLITGGLVREAESSGSIDLPRFYARRARRLLPAATLTLAVVCLASYVWMPSSMWPSIATDMAASSLYIQNWALVRRTVDYLAQDQPPSPLQHFWSLSVEEQFYMVWPLLMVGAAAWRRRRSRQGLATNKHGAPATTPSPFVGRGASIRRACAVTIVTLCAASLATAVFYAWNDGSAGYFFTHTRLYELGLGGLLAVAVYEGRDSKALHISSASGGGAGDHGADTAVLAHAPSSLFTHWTRTVLASAGLAAIGVSGFWFTRRLPYPGVAALVPTLGAAAVILAGEQGPPSGGDDRPAHAFSPLFAHAWLQSVGDTSYSLYLTHWPVVVLYPYITGRTVDGFLADGVFVIVLSWILARASKLAWEDRFRSVRGVAEGSGMAGPEGKAGAARPVLVAALLTTLAIAAASFWLASQAASQLSRLEMQALEAAPGLPEQLNPFMNGSSSLTNCPWLSQNSSDIFPGANAVLDSCPVLNSVSLKKTRPPVSTAIAEVVKRHEMPTNLAGMSNFSSRHVVLLGDSHASHWAPAFEELSNRTGVRFSLMFRRGCPPSLTLIRRVNPPRESSPDVECLDLMKAAIDEILKVRPSLVVLSSYSNYEPVNGGGEQDVAHGVAQLAKKIVAADIPVVGIRSTPILKHNVPDCLLRQVAAKPDAVDASICATYVEKAMPIDNPVDVAAQKYPLMRLLSFNDILCPGGMCLPVIGNVIVYWDAHHMTETFSRTNARALQHKLLAAAPHLESLRKSQVRT